MLISDCVCITKYDLQGEQWSINHIFDVAHCLSETPKMMFTRPQHNANDSFFCVTIMMQRNQSVHTA